MAYYSVSKVLYLAQKATDGEGGSEGLGFEAKGKDFFKSDSKVSRYATDLEKILRAGVKGKILNRISDSPESHRSARFTITDLGRMELLAYQLGERHRLGKTVEEIGKRLDDGIKQYVRPERRKAIYALMKEASLNGIPQRNFPGEEKQAMRFLNRHNWVENSQSGKSKVLSRLGRVAFASLTPGVPGKNLKATSVVGGDVPEKRSPAFLMRGEEKAISNEELTKTLMRSFSKEKYVTQEKDEPLSAVLTNAHKKGWVTVGVSDDDVHYLQLTEDGVSFLRNQEIASRQSIGIEDTSHLATDKLIAYKPASKIEVEKDRYFDPAMPLDEYASRGEELTKSLPDGDEVIEKINPLHWDEMHDKNRPLVDAVAMLKADFPSQSVNVEVEKPAVSVSQEADSPSLSRRI
jgi:hypothetical protein